MPEEKLVINVEASPLLQMGDTFSPGKPHFGIMARRTLLSGIRRSACNIPISDLEKVQYETVHSSVNRHPSENN